ncbi:MAG: hypothetical protein ACMXYF_01285 [Candidatus Woesearchaeota archaeon]
MTVINALVFNPEMGAIVSDEQSSSQSRKENTAKKVFPLYDKGDLQVLIGEAGPVSENLEVIYSSQYQPLGASSFLQVAKHVSKKAAKQRLKSLKHFLKGKHGLPFKQVKRGKDKKGADIHSYIIQAYMSDFSQGCQQQNQIGSFVLLGKSANEPAKIIYFDSRNKNLYPMFQGHYSTGSGADASNLELSKFMNDIPRNNRNNINPVEGLEVLLYATHLAGSVNHGVGGIPDIGIIHNDKIIQPGEYESQLAGEISQLKRRDNLIRPEFAYEAMKGLLLEDANFDAVYDDLQKESQSQGTQRQVDQFLRGYRI